MSILLEEQLVGSLEIKNQFIFNQLEVGPGNYLGFDLSQISTQFDQAELRAMSRSGLTLRHLARKLNSQMVINDGNKVGVYSLSHDGAGEYEFLNEALKSPFTKAFVRPAKAPPKSSVVLCASTNASQVAMELELRGPILTIQPSPDAIDFLIEEIKLDSTAGVMNQCIVACAVSFEDPFEWAELIIPPPKERALILSLEKITDQSLNLLRLRLLEFFE